MANVVKLIKNSKEEIQKTMQNNLVQISASMIDQMMKKYRGLSNAKKLNAIKDIKGKGVAAYKNELLSVLAVVASESIDIARKEIPNTKNVKFIENEDRLLFGEFEKLPPKIRNRIKNANNLLIGSQVADLEKALFFQFSSSVNSEKTEKEIQADLSEKAESYIGGNSISAGAAVTSANIVNEVRSAFFFEDDVLDQIEAFEFMNGDPVSPICNDFAGLIISKNDPNLFRYTPPLHYNCKSWLRPIIKLRKNQKIESFEPSTKELKKTIQFSEAFGAMSCDCHLSVV